jgi:chromosome segregation ATPase
MTTQQQAETQNGIALNPKVQADMKAADGILTVAKAYEIDGPETEEMAAEELREIKRRQKALDTQRKEMTRPLDESKKRIMELFKTPLDALSQAERLIKAALGKYHEAIEKERRRLEAEARERARKEQEKLQKRAEQAAEKGQAEKAEMLQEQAEQTAAPIVAKHKAPAGVSARVIWSAEVTDKMELIKAVAAGTVPHTVLEPNMAVLNRQAVALQDAMCYPGVKAVSKKSYAARG